MSSQYIPLVLPSKGLAYEGIQVDTLQIRTFTGREAELLDELGFGNTKKKFLEIIKNVLQGIEPSKLTSGDAAYIMLWEAINSYEATFPINIVCENCLDNIRVKADLSKINCVDLDDSFVPLFDAKLAKETIQMRLPTLQDEINTLDFVKTGHTDYLYSYACVIVNDKDVLANLEMLRDLPLTDIRAIEKAQQKFKHGPDMEAPYTCPHCTFGGKVLIPFRFEELFSFRDES